MDAHGVEVLDGADDDHVVGGVAHDLELVLLPAEDALVDEDLAHWRQVQPPGHDLAELVLVVGDTAALTAQGVAGAHDGRQPHRGQQSQGLIHGGGDARQGHGQTLSLHARLEALAILRHGDGLWTGADELHVELGEHAGLVQLHGEVQPRLPPHRGEQRVWPLPLDDLTRKVEGQRLDIGDVCHLGIGHDGGRVAVEQHHPKAQLPKGFAGLRARIIELAGLPDDDRTRADHHDALDVGPQGHVDLARLAWLAP